MVYRDPPENIVSTANDVTRWLYHNVIDDDIVTICGLHWSRKGDFYSVPPVIPMLLTCPLCGERHIDEGEFASKPHHTHACQHCGMAWRPAIVNTVGVRFLPGFKDGE
jgi:hypothetical protein